MGKSRPDMDTGIYDIVISHDFQDSQPSLGYIQIWSGLGLKRDVRPHIGPTGCASRCATKLCRIARFGRLIVGVLGRLRMFGSPKPAGAKQF